MTWPQNGREVGSEQAARGVARLGASVASSPASTGTALLLLPNPAALGCRLNTDRHNIGSSAKAACQAADSSSPLTSAHVRFKRGDGLFHRLVADCRHLRQRASWEMTMGSG